MKKLMLLILAGSCGLVWAQTNTPVGKKTAAKAPVQPTEINSQSADFDINIRRAIYRGHVVVIDPKVQLRCELLSLDLPSEGGRLSHVSAETNVVIDFTGDKGEKYHVTSDKAVYIYKVANSVTNETVTFTGNPKVETADGEITSEPMIWDRATGHFKFNNPVMKSWHSLGGGETNGSPVNLFK
jgi:lipopolysaccharide export system protein LptA